MSSDWLSLSHMPFLQPITAAGEIACFYWSATSHVLQWEGMPYCMAYGGRGGEWGLSGSKSRMLTLMVISLPGRRAPEMTVLEGQCLTLVKNSTNAGSRPVLGLGLTRCYSKASSSVLCKLEWHWRTLLLFVLFLNLSIDTQCHLSFKYTP